MNHRQKATIQYTAGLANQVNAFLGNQFDTGMLRTVLLSAFSRINRDIVLGKSAQLPFLGDVSRSSCGEDVAMIRFVADVDLLNECQDALDAIRAVQSAAIESTVVDIPIEDWPINEDNRFRRRA